MQIFHAQVAEGLFLSSCTRGIYRMGLILRYGLFEIYLCIALSEFYRPSATCELNVSIILSSLFSSIVSLYFYCPSILISSLPPSFYRPSLHPSIVPLYFYRPSILILCLYTFIVPLTILIASLDHFIVPLSYYIAISFCHDKSFNLYFILLYADFPCASCRRSFFIELHKRDISDGSYIKVWFVQKVSFYSSV
jgi:hypothetical protein